MHVAYTEALQMMILWLQMHVHQSTSHNISGSVSRPPPHSSKINMILRAVPACCHASVYTNPTPPWVYIMDHPWLLTHEYPKIMYISTPHHHVYYQVCFLSISPSLALSPRAQMYVFSLSLSLPLDRNSET